MDTGVGGVYPSCWDEGEDMLVRAPGLEPEYSGKEPFSLLRDLAQLCLDEINKGRTATSTQLLSMPAADS